MNEYNDNDEMDGYWEKYHSNGRLWYKGNFINGQFHGYWEWYNTRHGKLEEKEFYL